jgi:hypothetical protein
VNEKQLFHGTEEETVAIDDVVITTMSYIQPPAT